MLADTARVTNVRIISKWWKRLGAIGREQLFTELLFTELYACAHLFASGPCYPPICE